MSNYRTADNEHFTKIFKALSNPHRLSIFMSLANCCYVQNTTDDTSDQVCTCVGTIAKDLDLAPSTVSHHLKELYGAGLIKMKRRGQTVDCWVDPDVIDSIITFINIKKTLMV